MGGRMLFDNAPIKNQERLARRMSATEWHIFSLLRFEYLAEDEPLTTDEATLKRITGAHTTRAHKQLKAIIKNHFYEEDGKLRNKEFDDLIVKIKTKILQRSLRAKNGHQNRKYAQR